MADWDGYADVKRHWWTIEGCGNCRLRIPFAVVDICGKNQLQGEHKYKEPVPCLNSLIPNSTALTGPTREIKHAYMGLPSSHPCSQAYSHGCTHQAASFLTNSSSGQISSLRRPRRWAPPGYDLSPKSWLIVHVAFSDEVESCLRSLKSSAESIRFFRVKDGGCFLAVPNTRM